MRSFAILVMCLAVQARAEEPPLPRFAEETASAGIRSAYEGDWAYMVGGGVAAFDCSGDGFPDLAFAGGSASSSLWRNRSVAGGPLRFEQIQSGIEMEQVTGAYPLDVDGDGTQDLMLLRLGEALLMRGLGGCQFERANEAWGFDGGDAWHTAFSATWEADEDWPTLAVGTYIDPKEEFFPWGSCTDNRLYRPQGNHFAPPLALEPGHCALSMLFTDWARRGTADLRVSNDREYYKGGQEQLWRMASGEAPRRYAEDEGWRPLRIWGMGIAARDITSDGFPDYALTSMADNKLQTLAQLPELGQAPRPDFVDIAFARGLTAHQPYTGGDRRPSTAWHAEWADVNADGLADLFLAKGNVAEMPDFAALDPNNLLIQRADGSFLEVGLEAGVASLGTARGGTLADLNLDGLPDLVVNNRWDNAQVWRNVTAAAGNWLELRLSQPGPNVDGVGAWIEVRTPQGTQAFEVTVGGGHAGGHMGWWHFGLGRAESAEVRVIWPHEQPGPWRRLAAGRFWLLSSGADPQEWRP